MKPTESLLTALERDKLARAEQMDDVSRALAGASLFDVLRDRLAWGVLVDQPDADEAAVEASVRERLGEMRERGQAE